MAHLVLEDIRLGIDWSQVEPEPGYYTFDTVAMGDPAGHGGEDEPAVAFEWRRQAAPKLSAPEPLVIDAFGQEQPVALRDGRLRAQVSVTPLFVTADQRDP
jgi:hypothetical protein